MPSGSATEIEDLLAFGHEDVEQLSALSAAVGVTQALREGRPNLAEREPGQALVQDPRHVLHGAGRDAGRDLHEDGPDGAALQVEDQQQALRRQVHQVETIEHHRVEPRPGRDAKLLGEHAEDLGGAPQDLLDGGAVGMQLAAQDLLVLRCDRRQPHQVIHVETVAQVGRDAARRGVHMKEEALGLELAHGGANRCGGHAERMAPGDRLAAGRFGGGDIGLNDRLQVPAVRGRSVPLACEEI